MAGYAWKILAVVIAPSDPDAPPAEIAAAGLPVHGSGFEKLGLIEVLERPSSAEVIRASIRNLAPEIVYVTTAVQAQSSQASGPLPTLHFNGNVPSAEELAMIFEGCEYQAVVLNISGVELIADALRSRRVNNVIYWPVQKQTTTRLSHVFTHAFFSVLRLAGTSVPEAFALAKHVLHVYGSLKADGIGVVEPSTPLFLSDVLPKLPDNKSVQYPNIPGLDFSEGIARAIPGWADVRLLAPRAELRLLLCGRSAMIDAQRLSFLGEALRALLVMETRSLRLMATEPCLRAPAHLPPGCVALRCSVHTPGGAELSVIIGAQPAVVASRELVEYALRSTMVVDSLSLQFRLPPPGVPPPVARSSQAVAGGVPVVDALVLTSVWAVQALKQLSQSNQYPALVSLGMAAVGNAATQSFRSFDIQRFYSIVTGLRPDGGAAGMTDLPSTSAAHGSLSAMGGELGEHSGFRTAEHNILDMPMSRVPDVAPHGCSRVPLSECSEAEFLEDLVAFTAQRWGRPLDAARFPDAKLNGSTLDLYMLYREVVSRGGFRMGNAINWKGQVFARMRNYTVNNRQTGIGTSLKKHYQNYLIDYEAAHPSDVTPPPGESHRAAAAVAPQQPTPPPTGTTPPAPEPQTF